MRNPNEQAGGRLAIAAFTGAVVGAGVARLLAPISGAVLRGAIGDSVESLQGAVSQRYRGLVDRGTALVERVHGSAGRAAAAIEVGARHYARAGELRLPSAASPSVRETRGL